MTERAELNLSKLDEECVIPGVVEIDSLVRRYTSVLKIPSEASEGWFKALYLSFDRKDVPLTEEELKAKAILYLQYRVKLP